MTEQIDRVRRCDRVVVSTPMWNWSIPAPLKNWIDVIVQPLLTFTLDADGGHIGTLGEGRPLHLLSRAAAPTMAGTPSSKTSNCLIWSTCSRSWAIASIPWCWNRPPDGPRRSAAHSVRMRWRLLGSEEQRCVECRGRACHPAGASISFHSSPVGICEVTVNTVPSLATTWPRETS